MMRKRSLRFAFTAVLLWGSASMLACQLGHLRVLIPDFVTSEVRGIQLYRVDDATGEVAAAGHIEFTGIEQTRDGERLKYVQYTAAGVAWLGPIYTRVIRDAAQPAAVQVRLAISNQLPAGWFRVASYNDYGTSPTSTGQTFVVGSEG